ncbi:hypothetical protein MY10362_004752 [Beauveria mimosiformis]
MNQQQQQPQQPQQPSPVQPVNVYQPPVQNPEAIQSVPQGHTHEVLPPSYDQAKAAHHGVPVPGPNGYPATVVPLNMLSDQPQPIDCPFCHRRTMTEIRKEGSSMQILVGALFCLVCVCLTCVPCLAGWFEDVEYRCSQCKNMVARRRHDGALEVLVPQTPVHSQYAQQPQMNVQAQQYEMQPQNPQPQNPQQQNHHQQHLPVQEIQPAYHQPQQQQPLTSHAIAWSCDAELAIATIEGIHIFLPEYPRSSGSSEGEKPPSERYAASPQFPLFMQTSGSLRPDPSINAPLCLFAGVHELPPPPAPPQPPSGGGGGADGAGGFPGVGRGKITGAGASLGQVIRVEWSPGGLGSNLRPVLTALTGHGAVICFGEHIDLRKAGGGGGGGGASSTMQVRSFKNWRTLWGLGALLPLPIAGGGRRRAELGRDVEVMNERITAFSWAKEILPGRALQAYETDDGEVVVMAVQFYSRDSAPDEKGWDIREVARFDASGPHVATDALDPDFASSGSAFSLKWSPWVTHEGKQIAALSYIAHNHVGFRRVVIEESWRQGETPSVKVDQHDMKGICLFLSTDAFVEWENIPWNDDGIINMRGIVASPFILHPFQIPLTGPSSSAALPQHRTSLCSTTYPSQDVPTNPNPITGLIIHHADPSSRSPAPHYSLVRQSCTATNQDWFQTTLPEDETPIPQWAEDLGQRTVRRIPLARALRGKDIDSDDSSDEDDGGDPAVLPDADLDPDLDVQMQEPREERSSSQQQQQQHVHPRRFRLWGLAASPGDGCTAAVVSKYNTQHPSRRDRAEVMFGWHVPGDAEEAPAAAAAAAGGAGGSSSKKTMAPPPPPPPPPPPLAKLTTEARVWEWMYGRGGQVPGTTLASDDTLLPVSSSLTSALRWQFRDVLPRIRCVFCEAPMRAQGAEAVCDAGHSFATCASSGMPIMAPGVSRVCAVCGLRCLQTAELARLAGEHLGRDVPLDVSAETCGGCGGKFIV